MPPPHLAVLNPQNPETAHREAPQGRGLFGTLRASMAASFERDGQKGVPATGVGEGTQAKSRLLRVPPLMDRKIGLPERARPTSLPDPASTGPVGLDHPIRAPIAVPREQTVPVAPTEVAAVPHSLLARPARVVDDQAIEANGMAPGGSGTVPRLMEPSPMAAPRQPPEQEDLLADLPPAQVPLRISVAPLPFSTPAPRPAVDDSARRPAAERAFRTGQQGARPAHAMSAAEIAAWREGAMEAGRSRDPIFGRPRLWWWLALSLILVLPMAYAAGWLGLSGSGSEFLSTPLGQEAWIALGGADAVWIYWGMLFGVAMLLQFLRPLEPLLILCAATWWGWTGLHAAWVAGWLAQRIPPMPLPG